MKLNIVTDPVKRADEVIRDYELTKSMNAGIQEAIKARFDQNKPIARFDKKGNRVYLLYRDGRKVYV
jgi:hypothetical protein